MRAFPASDEAEEASGGYFARLEADVLIELLLL